VHHYVTIPKILHHVWLGKEQIPINLQKCIKTCYDVHSEWKHMFWTDDNLPNMEPFVEEYDIDNNYARKSDLVRIMALYHYGGVYLDTDVECIKPIENLLTGYKFIVATEAGTPGEFNPGTEHINNAVIATTKSNNILIELINQVQKNYKRINITNKEPLDYVAKLAGPPVFNKMSNIIREDEYSKIYPYEYFYPLHYVDKISVDKWKIPSDKQKLDKKTHMIHHFAASWYNQK